MPAPAYPYPYTGNQYYLTDSPLSNDFLQLLQQKALADSSLGLV